MVGIPYKNCDEWGMVYDIALPTLMTDAYGDISLGDPPPPL